MFLITYFNRFIFFSIAGWIYESIYCAITHKHWSNRGFLFGPLCPIYGFGAVAAILLFGELPEYLSANSASNAEPISYSLWQVFVICLVGSAVLEYITATLLEVFFHAKWWDYSKVPLNIKGRVSLPTSCGFGAAGVLIVQFVMPWVMGLPSNEHPTSSTLLALVLALALGMDLGFTIESLTSVINKMESFRDEFDTHMETTVQLAQLGPGAVAVAAGSAARIAALNAAEAAAETASNVKDTTMEKANELKENTLEKAEELRDSAMDLSTEWLKEHRLTGMEIHHIGAMRKYIGKKENNSSSNTLKKFREMMDASKRISKRENTD